MKKFIAFFTFLFIVISCEKKQGNMIVKGNINGLKKGTLYLQKVINKKLTSVDSVEIFRDSNFELSDNNESPEMYSLTLKGNFQDSLKKEQKLMFFGEQGTITINDNIEQFGWKPKISGSKNQELYEKFKKIDDTFKMKRLQFIVDDNEARMKKDTAEIKRLENTYKKMMSRRFASTIQFALNNKDYEVAPYLAIAELFDANFIYVDSINNNLSDKVKKSKYGIELQKYVDEVKASQQ